MKKYRFLFKNYAYIIAIILFVFLVPSITINILRLVGYKSFYSKIIALDITAVVIMTAILAFDILILINSTYNLTDQFFILNIGLPTLKIAYSDILLIRESKDPACLILYYNKYNNKSGSNEVDYLCIVIQPSKYEDFAQNIRLHNRAVVYEVFQKTEDISDETNNSQPQ